MTFPLRDPHWLRRPPSVPAAYRAWLDDRGSLTRRSLFTLRGAPILVTEVFLPGILRLA